MFLSRKAISTARAAIIIAIIVVAATAVYFAGGGVVSPPAATTTGTTQSSLSVTKSQIPETLVIEDTMWPIHDLNALYQLLYVPWPWWLEHTVYQTLVVTDVKAQFGEGRIEFVPDLATEWTVSDDKTTFAYDLRQGVKFSSGNPFNAYQVWTEMYAWYYLNSNGSNFLGALDIFDTSHVNVGPATFELLKSSGLANPTGEALAIMQDKSWPIYANGPYQIVFHTKAPFLHLNGLLVGFQGLIFDCQWALDNGGFGTPAEFNPYFGEHPIPGTGPYVVAEVAMNSHVKFEQNPSYWGSALSPEEITKNPIVSPGVVKTVIVRAVVDDLTRYTDLTTGAAQLATIGSANWNLIKNNPRYAYFSVKTSAAIYALAFNTKISPTDNPNLRQAIAHAINYEEIWKSAFNGEVSAVMGPETPNYGVYYNPGNLPPYDYNVDKAKEFLAKAGYPEGKGLPTLGIRIPTGTQYNRISAEVVQSNLADIGINVVIMEFSPATYWAPYGNYETNAKNAKELGHMTFLGVWAPSALTPTDYWTGFVSSRSLWGNYAAYSDPTVDKAVLKLSQTGDINEITDALKIAQEKIYNDAPYAWIGTTNLWAYDGSVVWDRNLIKQVYFDPCYSGVNTAPIFNTIEFV